MKLDELQVYQLSMELGEKIWNHLISWDYFAKDTIGPRDQVMEELEEYTNQQPNDNQQSGINDTEHSDVNDN